MSNSTQSQEKESPVEDWSTQEEEILIRWSDKALCYRWLHEHSEKRFRKFNYALTIPVIILSTLTGTANFGIGSIVPESFLKNAQLIIGGVNIFAGILSTLQNFFRYAQNTEAHHNASAGWAKFYRNVSTELIMEPSKRQPAREFLFMCRREYDRLIEMSPSIPRKIIAEFNQVFGKNPNFANVVKPEVCDVLEHTETYTDFISQREVFQNNLLEKVKQNLPNYENTVEDGKKILEEEVQKKMDRIMNKVSNPNIPHQIHIDIPTSEKQWKQLVQDSKQSIQENTKHFLQDSKQTISTITKPIHEEIQKTNDTVRSRSNSLMQQMMEQQQQQQQQKKDEPSISNKMERLKLHTRKELDELSSMGSVSKRKQQLLGTPSSIPEEKPTVESLASILHKSIPTVDNLVSTSSPLEKE